MTLTEVDKKVLSWKNLLKAARNKRSHPNLDDKVLTSWNGLMLQGYIDAYKAFGETTHLETAIKNANFLVDHQLRKDGGLYRSFKKWQ